MGQPNHNLTGINDLARLSQGFHHYAIGISD